MNLLCFDNVANSLRELIHQREIFHSAYDKRAGEFLDGLPGIFHLLQRLAFDLDIAPEHRRRAALIAIYIAEPHDYLGEANLGVEGLVDDLWLAYTGLHQFSRDIPIHALQQHWRSEVTLSHVIELSHDVQSITNHVPSRVLEKLKAFIEPEQHWNRRQQAPTTRTEMADVLQVT